MPKLAAEFAQLRVDAILAEGTAAIQAAKDTARTVPIVMATSNDPVASGFVEHQPVWWEHYRDELPDVGASCAAFEPDAAPPSVDFLCGNHTCSAVWTCRAEGADVFREWIRCR